MLTAGFSNPHLLASRVVCGGELGKKCRNQGFKFTIEAVFIRVQPPVLLNRLANVTDLVGADGEISGKCGHSQHIR